MKTELETRLRRLDRIETPDLWPDATSRTPKPPRNGPSGLRTAALVVACLATVAASLVLLARAFDRGSSAGPSVPASPPVALPANGDIWAFAGGGDGGGSAVFSVDPATGQAIPLWQDNGWFPPGDHVEPKLVASDYAWSPDGTRVAFSHTVPPPPDFPSSSIPPREIFVMNADGSDLTQLTHDEAYDGFPAWSPDGSHLLFTSFPGSAPEPNCLDLWDCPGDLFEIAADGSGERQITSGPAADSMASWSPDGALIVFRSTRDGSRGHIFVMNADGSNVTQLTSGDEFDLAPHWSPDGKAIAFLASDQQPDSTFRLWVMNADGSGRQLLADTGLCCAPGPQIAWSPDGTEIAFSRYEESLRALPLASSIHVIRPDGTGERRLGGLPANEGFSPIAWQPLSGGSPR